MNRSFTVLITDGNAKHSIALQRHLRKAMPEIRIVAHAPEPFAFCRYQRGAHRIVDGELEQRLQEDWFDMVIPVGGTAVRLVLRYCPNKAALAPESSIETCFDKAATAQLAMRLGIPCPATWRVTSLGELDALDLPPRTVLKPNNEAELKAVCYPETPAEVRVLAERLLRKLPAKGTQGLLIQERAAGVGRGYFTVYDRGTPVVEFMHERVRELPPTGGASTAARAIYDAALERYARSLLGCLDWHGPAMVEFKYEASTGQYNLIEINAKFWGSLELGLSAGVDFGAALVRLFRDEPPSSQTPYDRNLIFAWPLDGDLEVIALTGQWRRASEYFHANVKTNLFQSFRSDLIKSMLMLRSIARTRRKGCGDG